MYRLSFLLRVLVIQLYLKTKENSREVSNKVGEKLKADLRFKTLYHKDTNGERKANLSRHVHPPKLTWKALFRETDFLRKMDNKTEK